MKIGGLLQYYMLNTVINFLFNPSMGVGSKMTPDITFRAWYDGKIKVAAVTFHENYAAGCHCLFQFCDRLKVTIYLYRLGHGGIFDPNTILRLCLTKLCKIVQLWSYIFRVALYS